MFFLNWYHDQRQYKHVITLEFQRKSQSVSRYLLLFGTGYSMDLTEKNNLIFELQNWIYCHEKIWTIHNSEDTVCYGCPLDFHTDLSCTRFTLIDSKQVHTIKWRLQYDESIWRKIAINSGITFKIKTANDKQLSAYLLFRWPNDSFQEKSHLCNKIDFYFSI